MIGSFGIEFVLPAKLRAIRSDMNFAGERMAHILDMFDAAVGVPVLFEGQYRK